MLSRPNSMLLISNLQLPLLIFKLISLLTKMLMLPKNIFPTSIPFKLLISPPILTAKMMLLVVPLVSSLLKPPLQFVEFYNKLQNKLIKLPTLSQLIRLPRLFVFLMTPMVLWVWPPPLLIRQTTRSLVHSPLMLLFTMTLLVNILLPQTVVPIITTLTIIINLINQSLLVLRSLFLWLLPLSFSWLDKSKLFLLYIE